MTAWVIWARITIDIREIARVMLNKHIHASPILDSNRRIVGILSMHDLLDEIAKHVPIELLT